MHRHLITILAGGIMCCSCLGAPVAKEQILQRTRKAAPHPRLFWTAQTESQIRQTIAGSKQMEAAWKAVLLRADREVEAPPVIYQKEGRRLLGRSREALSRVSCLGLAYRITGKKEYRTRIEAEMRAMAAMPDWNPSHFLDVAEMTLAMSIAYDWAYPELSAEMRALGKQAIETKGLAAYFKSRQGWEAGRNNWNQVCHAGMIAGALALAEDDPERAAQVISRALAGLPNVMRVYDPDGNYPEGPGYWEYGTSFNVLAVAELESALGTDFGLSRSPGFLKAADFPLYTMGPTRLPFNFSDCGTGSAFSPAVVWFASRTARPELLFFQHDLLAREVARTIESKGRAGSDRLFPFMFLWAGPAAVGSEPAEPRQLSWFAQGENPVATFRSSWSDPNAVFLAVKAGTPSASHAHMDIGSFVLDDLGERWSMDLGAENYNKIEQLGINLWSEEQGSERWGIFRYHNRAHSTLMVNDAEQVAKSKAAITSFSGEGANAGATIDLSGTYAGQLARAQRTFSFLGSNGVRIQDDIVSGDRPAKVRWGMTTQAQLKTDGAGAAWLMLHGKKMRMQVRSPASVVIRSWAADPPPHSFDAANPGVSIVGFEVALNPNQSAKLEVTLEPAAAQK